MWPGSSNRNEGRTHWGCTSSELYSLLSTVHISNWFRNPNCSPDWQKMTLSLLYRQGRSIEWCPSTTSHSPLILISILPLFLTLCLQSPFFLPIPSALSITLPSTFFSFWTSLSNQNLLLSSFFTFKYPCLPLLENFLGRLISFCHSISVSFHNQISWKGGHLYILSPPFYSPIPFSQEGLVP